jgi:carboxymethylenebutenolidase
MQSPEPAVHDLGSVFDEHVRHEFIDRDVDATMRTMISEPYVVHLPTMTGGVGGDAVRAFYGHHFIGRRPADTNIEPVSRTVGQDRVVDELIIRFTHDVEMPVLLPGVPPTGRVVELPLVVVMGFENGKVAYEHIYWDQASLLVQGGLLDPEQVPAVGADAATWMRNRSGPLNRLLDRAS